MLSIFEEDDADDSPASLFSVLPKKKDVEQKSNKNTESKYQNFTLNTQQITLSQLDVQSGNYVPVGPMILIANRESDIIKLVFASNKNTPFFTLNVSESISWNYQSQVYVTLSNLGITWLVQFNSPQDARLMTIIALSSKLENNGYVCIRDSKIPHSGSEILSYESYDLSKPISRPTTTKQENTVDETKFASIQSIASDQSEYIYKNDTTYSYIMVSKAAKEQTPLANPLIDNQNNLPTEDDINISQHSNTEKTQIENVDEEEEEIIEIEEIIDDGKSSIIALRNEVDKRLEELQILLKSNIHSSIESQLESKIINPDKLQEAADRELARSADLDRRLADVTRRLQAAERLSESHQNSKEDDNLSKLWEAKEELSAEEARLADAETDCDFGRKVIEELQCRFDGAEAEINKKMDQLREDSEADIQRESTEATAAIKRAEDALGELWASAAELRRKAETERAEAANLRRGGDSPEVRTEKEAISSRIAAVVRQMADYVASLVEDNFEEGKGYGGRVVVSAIRTALEAAADNAAGEEDDEEEDYDED